MNFCTCKDEIFLTSTYFGDNSLCQSTALSQLLPKALTHVVIHIVGSQELFKGLEGGENLIRHEHVRKKLSLGPRVAGVDTTSRRK